MKTAEITVLPDLQELSKAAAQQFVEVAKAAITERKTFRLALAGGSTPKKLYELISDPNEPFRSAIDWPRIEFFWGDERCVLPEDKESNFRMANESLLIPLGISTTKIHRYKTELAAPEAAAEYERLLRLIFNIPAGAYPRFDLVLLGMGEDGHTASLFPHSDALHANGDLVAAPFVEKFESHRLTITPSVINNADNVIFLVAGDGKAAALREVLEGDKDPDKFPAQMVEPSSGRTSWFLDQSAASLLTINRKYENFSGHLRR
jgi:6-phosphogluconolactonase